MKTENLLLPREDWYKRNTSTNLHQWLPIEEGKELYWFDVKTPMGSYQTLYTTDPDEAYEMLLKRCYKVIGCDLISER